MNRRTFFKSTLAAGAFLLLPKQLTKTPTVKPTTLTQIHQLTLLEKIKKDVSKALEHRLFENNTEELRDGLTSETSRYMERYRAQRMVVDYKVVCDETNNPPNVIDNNSLVVDIYIKQKKADGYSALSFQNYPA